MPTREPSSLALRGLYLYMRDEPQADKPETICTTLRRRRARAPWPPALRTARAQCGARLTETREAVLALILEAGRPLTAYETFGRPLGAHRAGRATRRPSIARWNS